MSDPMNPALPPDPADGPPPAPAPTGYPPEAGAPVPQQPGYGTPYVNPSQPMAQYPAQPQQYPTQPPGAPYGYPPPQVYVYTQPAQKGFPLLSTFSVIFGAASILLSWLFPVALLASAVALILGFVARKKEPQAKGGWLTGIILAFTGLAIGVVILIVILTLGLGLSGVVNNIPTPPINQ